MTIPDKDDEEEEEEKVEEEEGVEEEGPAPVLALVLEATPSPYERQRGAER